MASCRASGCIPKIVAIAIVVYCDGISGYKCDLLLMIVEQIFSSSQCDGVATG